MATSKNSAWGDSMGQYRIDMIKRSSFALGAWHGKNKSVILGVAFWLGVWGYGVRFCVRVNYRLKYISKAWGT